MSRFSYDHFRRLLLILVLLGAVFVRFVSSVAVTYRPR